MKSQKIPFNKNEIEGKQAPSCKKFDTICEVLVVVAIVYFIAHLIILITK